MEAMIMGRLFQSLNLRSTDSVMTIASSTGYAAAVLSHLVVSVIWIEAARQW